MAWVNAVIPDFTTGTITGDITNISTVVNPQSKQARANEYYTNFSYAVSFNQINYVNIAVDSRQIIYGDSNLGLAIKRTNSGFIQLEYTYYAGVAFSEWRVLKSWTRSAIMAYSDQVHNTSLFFTINEETHHGTIIAYSIDFNTGYESRVDHAISYAVELTDTELAYNIIQSQIPIVYNWQSVPSISGKNGISLLSIIKNSAINSGDAVSGASADAFDRLEETTKISTLIQGITEETPIIYSDDVNYMSITPTANNTCTLKFYLHGSVIYTLTDVSINAYLSFLIDETNGIMKPSIIYEDS